MPPDSDLPNAPGAAFAHGNDRGVLSTRISDAMVHLYKDLFGRGPTRVRSHFVGRDMLICVLQDTFTPAERSMAEMGEHHRLRDMRMFFQYASEDQFKEIVEDILDRRVTSFVSGIDTKTDTAIEVFVMDNARPEPVS
jgi:uncharacterized protein YbcI